MWKTRLRKGGKQQVGSRGDYKVLHKPLLSEVSRSTAVNEFVPAFQLLGMFNNKGV